MKDYSKAYTEVLEIIKYLPQEEKNKIPQSKIDFFKNNMDKIYEFKYDDTLLFEENEVMDETKAIFVILFRDYFASEKQKKILQEILIKNEQYKQEKLKEKYSYENLFNKDDSFNKNVHIENRLISTEKENFFIKIINRIKKFFKI